MSDLPEIERLQAVAVQPGDVIVATLANNIASEMALARIREVLTGVFPDHQVLVLPDTVDLSVKRPSGVST